MFEAPVPGQSLTESPGKYPYERPPEIVDPEEAIQMYLTRLNEPDRLDGIVDMIELGVDLKTLTEGILRNGVASGMHSIDVSLIVAPVLHEFIKTTADQAGVTYDEGFVNEKEESKQRKAINAAKAKRKLKKEGISQRAATVERAVPEASEEPAPRGLMERRTPKDQGIV